MNHHDIQLIEIGQREGYAKAIKDIATWLNEMYDNCESIDGMLTRMDSKDELLNMMQAKFGGKNEDR